MSKQAAPSRLFALLIGINKYQAPIRSLKGCLNDITTVENYLTEFESKNFDLHIERLSDESATRENVINCFKNQLAKATAEDVVLFYYSGHGAQEMADTDIWRFEPDNKLEGLVLYDSVKMKEKDFRLLADKELRHLLHFVATRNEKNEVKEKSPHIVVITDCCHSGENTRSHIMETSAGAVPRLASTKSGDVFPKRPWEHFCFANDISPKALRTELLQNVMPQAAHVSMSACQSDEKAWEVDKKDGPEGEREGVFTRNLIEILKRCQGTVTYHDLRSRICYYIKAQHHQVPQIYAVGDDHAAYKTFLGGDAGSKPMQANVLENETLGWIMDMGAIHGVSQQVANEIDILNKNGETTWRAVIKKVELESTQLEFPDGKAPPSGKEYRAVIQHFLSAPTNVYLNNADMDEDAEGWLRQQFAGKGQNLHLAEAENQADFTVQIMYDYYAITKPGDPNRPLVKPELLSKEGAVQTYHYLQHISQFNYVRDLENTASNQLNPDSIKVEFLQTQKTGDPVLQPISNVQGKEFIDMEYNDKEQNEFGETRDTGYLRIKLTNESTQPLFVALLYLSNDFMSYTELLGTLPQRLEPGGFVWAAEGGDIGLNYEPYIQVLNLPSTNFDFKIIISQKQFGVDQFKLEALPTFDQLIIPERHEADRGGLRVKKTTTKEGDAWTTRLITLRIKNPNHDRVSKSELNNWLKTAGGLYIESVYLADSQPFGGGERQLMEPIEWKEDQGERGLKKLGFNVAVNLANKWYRRQRRKLYKRTRKRHPDYPVIVSEGDSWFQFPHPNLKEIIDHLLDQYAVLSLGAAGDTIDNYFRKGELFSALATEQADFLLLSGGGNDILGPEIKELLADDIDEDAAPEGAQPERFLNEQFKDKMERLSDIYRRIFERVQSDHPQVQVICHGYDYILPNPKTGWFGVHLKDKVKRRGDQKALADLLIDRFNEKMIETAKSFPNVHFLDNRNTVKEFLWHDEIHPNTKGFFDVALKFHQKLNELRSGRV